jgi:hypothetical protein
MMSGPIPGLQQPRNDIDNYFKPMVEDLKELWYNDGVQAWDEHKHALWSQSHFICDC